MNMVFNCRESYKACDITNAIAPMAAFTVLWYLVNTNDNGKAVTVYVC